MGSIQGSNKQCCRALAYVAAVGLVVTSCSAREGTESNTESISKETTYIVRLRQMPEDISTELARFPQGTIRHIYRNIFPGFAVSVSSDSLLPLAASPNVYSITPSRSLQITGSVQDNSPWNLDRLDRARPPLDRKFHYMNDGTGVRVFVVDTGVAARLSDFEGRVETGVDVSSDAGTTYQGGDVHGHGTHVAGIIASKTYGVAKGARIVPVKVFDHGMNSVDDSVFLAGLDWAIASHKATPGPAVMNISIAGEASDNVDAAVRSVLDSGIAVVLGAGNNAKDACQFSPARELRALTIGATMQGETRSYFSNVGPCLDGFAPGSQIASLTRQGGRVEMDGTSMAAPHVAGLAAAYLQTHQGATPAQVFEFLISKAARNGIVDVGTESPNLFFNGEWNAGR